MEYCLTEVMLRTLKCLRKKPDIHVFLEILKNPIEESQLMFKANVSKKSMQTSLQTLLEGDFVSKYRDRETLTTVYLPSFDVYKEAVEKCKECKYNKRLVLKTGDFDVAIDDCKAKRRNECIHNHWREIYNVYKNMNKCSDVTKEVEVLRKQNTDPENKDLEEWVSKDFVEYGIKLAHEIEEGLIVTNEYRSLVRNTLAILKRRCKSYNKNCWRKYTKCYLYLIQQNAKKKNQALNWLAVSKAITFEKMIKVVEIHYKKVGYCDKKQINCSNIDIDTGKCKYNEKYVDLPCDKKFCTAMRRIYP